jgi:hypothetical protein
MYQLPAEDQDLSAPAVSKSEKAATKPRKPRKRKSEAGKYKSPHIHNNFRVCESIATRAKPSEAQIDERDRAYEERALLPSGAQHLGDPPPSRSAPSRPSLRRRSIEIDLPAILRARAAWLRRTGQEGVR